MSLKDKLSAGAERAAKEAEKAFEKGKAKVGELQIELQMDGHAKKLGYLVFDFYRGREVDQNERQRLLDELSRLEDQLAQARAEAAARAETETGAKAAGESAAPPAEDAMWHKGPEGGRSSNYPPVPPFEPDCGMPASTSEAARESAERIAKNEGPSSQGDA